ncbi:hypothetical protein DPMN_148703, partial [Dreissena polymorpha]
MATQWIPPLPPGFEARWDPTQRAYFFIDHTNKTTTWQDPRFPPSGPVPPPVTHQAAAQSLNQGAGLRPTGGATAGQKVPMSMKSRQVGATTTIESSDSSSSEEEEENFDNLFASSQEEKVDLMKLHQLRQSFPSAPEDVIQQLLKSHHNNTVRVSNALHEMGYKRAEAVSHPEPRRVDILERVRAMYPDTDKEVIDSVFKSCEGDERTMRQVLDRMGYKPKFPETHRNPSAKGERSTSPAKGKVPMKPAQRETTPKKQESPAKVAPPAEPELSIGQKSQLVSKLQSLYKDLEKSVIEMACEVCKWDETRAKNVLELMKDDMSRPVTSTSRPTTSQTQRSPSPSPAPLSPASLEPVSMMHDEPSRPGHHNNTVRVSNALHEMGYKRAEAVSHPEPRRVDILERVRAMYPDTDKEVIDSVFKSCEGDERTMRQVLDRMGYKPKFPETHRNPSAKGERSTSPAKGKVPMKPAQRETTPKKQESPAKVAPPAEPELSIGQKSQLVSKLQSLYKDLEKSVIEMACEVCKWDETRAKNVLELMKDDMSRPVTSTSRPTTSQTQRSPSPSPAPLSPASLEPVSMMLEEPSRPGTSTSSASSKTYMKASDFTSRASSAMGTKVSIQKPAQGKYTGSQSKSNVATTGSQSKSQ